ncbi:hypothetical protein IMX26_04280 [Clostridium sp. 'deep sea']|uniref:hypothetical protein n=1 Tax=Clostridium sp. 'deep sea' TaxID=2779445 RepID=UPI0018969471|nr:hypothetical protein [Clostridium sp. 'deep sea']QOR37044.1 hypothetical protein IMX26_04280 [Clostridium sp. 'deep sea']
MSAIVAAVLFWVVLGFGVFFIVPKLKNNFSGIKVILIGISIILVGGIIAVDTRSDLGGYEYLVVFLGLIIAAIGFGKKD